jgi:hypothetical protein
MNDLQKALKMLACASILSVNGVLIHNWDGDIESRMDDAEDDKEIVFEFSYTDAEEGLIFEFEFTKKDFLEVKVLDNQVQLVDATGEMIKIDCLSLIKYSV